MGAENGVFLRDREVSIGVTYMTGTLVRVGQKLAEATDIFLSQLTSRKMDRLSRALQARGEGFYTIGTSGHEGNAAIAAALSATALGLLPSLSTACQLTAARPKHGLTPHWAMLPRFEAQGEDRSAGRAEERRVG